jgi:hypothetical protein
MASHRYTIRALAGDCEFSSDLVSKALSGQMRRSPTAVLERLCAAVGLRVSLTERVPDLAPMDSVVAALLRALAGSDRSHWYCHDEICAAAALATGTSRESATEALRGLIHARQVCEAQVTRHGATAHVVYLSCIAPNVGHQTRPFVVRRRLSTTTTTHGA